jgi:hypothetical protein
LPAARRADPSTSDFLLFFVTRLDFPKNQKRDPRRPALAQEGRFAIVTNVGRGMRWTRQVSAQSFARTTDPDADGEGVLSWPPDAEVKSCEMIARRRGQESPVSGASTYKP